MRLSDVYARAAVALTPSFVWIVLLATKTRLWERQPRMTSGTAPPFAAIGSIAQMFATALLLVACFHPRRVVAIPAGLVGLVTAVVYLVIAFRL